MFPVTFLSQHRVEFDVSVARSPKAEVCVCECNSCQINLPLGRVENECALPTFSGDSALKISHSKRPFFYLMFFINRLRQSTIAILTEVFIVRPHFKEDVGI